MTELPALTPTSATGARRAVQMIRAWRRRDASGMNAVMAECEDGSATDVMVCLLGWLSDLLDRMPTGEGEVDAMLSDLVLDFALAEKPTSSGLRW